ncbi:hypothetical protein [uncultured Clostridium sp.]|uniref:hypothetical protein n=1 Tax=uncultured Clostridium sp. TaxID=59620 RepID=UPI0026003890|nr:hypothetical protein [uncultured Clostridium sp.]
MLIGNSDIVQSFFVLGELIAEKIPFSALSDIALSSLIKNVKAVTGPKKSSLCNGRGHTFPLEERGQISLRSPRGMAKTFASSVPVRTFPVGVEEEKISGGDVEVRRFLARFLTSLEALRTSSAGAVPAGDFFLP